MWVCSEEGLWFSFKISFLLGVHWGVWLGLGGHNPWGVCSGISSGLGGQAPPNSESQVVSSARGLEGIWSNVFLISYKESKTKLVMEVTQENWYSNSLITLGCLLLGSERI